MVNQPLQPGLAAGPTGDGPAAPGIDNYFHFPPSSPPPPTYMLGQPFLPTHFQTLSSLVFVSHPVRSKGFSRKMEQNEMGCQTPQAPILCVNNCGFFGTAATMNMCSKCYKDFILKQQQAELAASSIQSIVNGNSNTSDKDSENIHAIEKAKAIVPEIIVPSPQASSEIEKKDEIKQGPKRCGSCKKRVGLTGFNCRCGDIFCAAHRYSDKHECPFDYRAAGQEAIAKANPIVKAEKLDKI